jgi:hypothetical protein
VAGCTDKERAQYKINLISALSSKAYMPSNELWVSTAKKPAFTISALPV